MKKSKRILLLVTLAGVVAIFWLFYAYDLGQFFTHEYIKQEEGALKTFYANNRLLVIGVYVGIYVVITALSIPGAAVLTVAGGMLFGLFWGTVIVSFTSTLGATLAFLIVRGLFHDFVQGRFREKWARVKKGFKKEGAFYLFAMRLVPIFPFFLVNILMALTPISVVRFFFVSQAGMLLGTIVYINAGTQLAQIESLDSVLSPTLLLSFAALGVLPLISKWVLNCIRQRKIMKKYLRPKCYDYNAVVIGAGSAGLVASYISAVLKAKVALIEKHKMGGDCLNTGCVPSKALVRVAKILADAKRSRAFGLTELKATFAFEEVMEHVQDVIQKVAPHDSVERYTELGVECISGEAKVLDPYRVSVNGNTLTTKNIIIATGGKPFIPEILGLEKQGYYTSDTIWGLRKCPEHLLVLGGGPIGCELAQCFLRLGSRVTIVQRNTRLLPREDEEISKRLKERFEDEGIEVLLSHIPTAFKGEGERKTLTCIHAGREVSVTFDQVLIAAGRKPCFEGLGLEALGVLDEKGSAQFDDNLQTRYPNIFICGDAANLYQFTHTASHQAWYATINALFRPFVNLDVDYSAVPWCTFTDPEIAHVGLNEQEATKRGIPYEATHFDIKELDRAIADVENYGVVKVLTIPGSDRILGATIVGQHAGDIISEFTLAMKNKLGLKKIMEIIHIYPTHSEASKYVAGVWRKNHASARILRLLEKVHRVRRKG